MNAILDRISCELNVSDSLLQSAIRHANYRVKQFTIDKRSGGKRKIIQPCSEVKLIQYWLIQNAFTKLPVHRIATAFVIGSSIKLNAIAHRKSRYAVRVDFRDFFPSIKPSDLWAVLDKIGQDELAWLKDKDAREVIGTVCFRYNKSLPIGYPSSPIISNIVMHEIDSVITNAIANDIDTFGLNVVTRYADDIVFSTDKPGACKAFVAKIKKILEKNIHPKLSLNEQKTRFMSRGGGSLIVTGIRICNDGHLTLHRNYKNRVESMLYAIKNDKLREEQLEELRGHLAFIKDADGGFLTRLSFNYAKELDAINSQ